MCECVVLFTVVGGFQSQRHLSVGGCWCAVVSLSVWTWWIITQLSVSLHSFQSALSDFSSCAVFFSFIYFFLHLHHGFSWSSSVVLLSTRPMLMTSRCTDSSVCCLPGPITRSCLLSQLETINDLPLWTACLTSCCACVSHILLFVFFGFVVVPMNIIIIVVFILYLLVSLCRVHQGMWWET